MTDRLQTHIEPTVTGLGYELLGIERSRGGGGQLLRLYIDHADGITVEDCERVSRQVSDLLDAEELVRGEYTLEVSSPGLDRPLKKPADFLRFTGETAQLRLRVPEGNQRNFTVVLAGVNDDKLMVEVDGVARSFELAQIERARLVPNFDKPKQELKR